MYTHTHTHNTYIHVCTHTHNIYTRMHKTRKTLRRSIGGRKSFGTRYY